jgi:hypothetical protein
VKNTNKLGPVAFCIYCRKTADDLDPGESLSSEHTLPEALGGREQLLGASCPACAKVTQYFEDQCIHQVFDPIRRTLDSAGKRHAKTRRRTFSVVYGPGTATEERRYVSIEDHPAALLMPIIPPPGIIDGERRDRGLADIRVDWWLGWQGETVQRAERLERADSEKRQLGVPYSTPMGSFYKFLAKIAHATATAHYGLDAFSPFLPEVILGQRNKVGVGPYFIGCAYFASGERITSIRRREPPYTHVLRFNEERCGAETYLVARMQLFANIEAPVYEAIVGSMTGGAAKPYLPAL